MSSMIGRSFFRPLSPFFLIFIFSFFHLEFNLASALNSNIDPGFVALNDSSSPIKSLYPNNRQKRIKTLKNVLNIRESNRPVQKEIRIYVRDLCKKGVITDNGFNESNVKNVVNSIFLAGDFNSWKPVDKLEYNPGISAEDAYFYKKYTLAPKNYAYKVVVNNRWLKNPSSLYEQGDGFGGVNSVLTFIHESDLQVLPFYSEHISQISNTDRYIYQFSVTGLAKRWVCLVNGQEQVSFMDRFQDFSLITLILKSSEFINKRACITISAMSEKDIDNNCMARPFDGWVYQNKKDYQKTGIIYFAMTDRFYNGKQDKPLKYTTTKELCSFMGGNINGLLSKARQGYFKKLNAQYVWLSPIYKNAAGKFRDSLPPHRLFEAYHGYWPVSLNSVDSRFGGLTGLRRLTSVLNKHKTGLMLDMVFNHVHKDSSLYDNPSWFVPLKLADGTANIRKFNEHPITTWFDNFLPSFDYSSSAARARIIENARWWASVTGSSGFRLDAVKHISDDFFNKFGPVFNKPDFFTVGETIDSREAISRCLEKNNIQAQFDFPLYFTIKEVFAKKSKGLDQLLSSLSASEKAFGDLTQASTLLGNHDFSRFMAYADNEFKPNENEKETAFNKLVKVDNPACFSRLEAAFAFLMTIKGHPLIYYGDEIGLTGAGDPDNRRPMIFGSDLNNNQALTLSKIRKLTEIRKSYPAFSQGTRYTLRADKNTLCYASVWFNQLCITHIKRRSSDKQAQTQTSTQAQTQTSTQAQIQTSTQAQKDLANSIQIPNFFRMPFDINNRNIEVLYGEADVTWNNENSQNNTLVIKSKKIIPENCDDKHYNDKDHNDKDYSARDFDVTIIGLFHSDH